jgi:hypothetical protein
MVLESQISFLSPSNKIKEVILIEEREKKNNESKEDINFKETKIRFRGF